MRTLTQWLIAHGLVCFSVLAIAADSDADLAEALSLQNSDLAVAPTSNTGTSTTAGTTDNTGVYVDLSAGYAAVNWSDFSQGAFDGYSARMGRVTNQGKGGFTAGVDTGYRINDYLGLEFAWYYLPQASGFSDITSSLPPLRVCSWLAYIALKPVLPLSKKSKRVELFGKFGGAYRSLKYGRAASNVGGFGNRNNSYVSAVLGGGLQYWLDQNWSVSAQYLYMWRNTGGNSITQRAPGANLILGSVGYQFGLY